MKLFQKAIASTLALVMFSPITPMLYGANGTENYTGGNNYREYRNSPQIGPGLALSAVALAAIIAVAVQRSRNSHSHSHS